ncbi:MAG: pyridoxal phosphate-dependent aminotransferase [Candidatus Marinimicrobia bacterium]|jgi:aspartate/methionine/tyrosine aminotransferase|nr:pyridoxal phosphate-dependent aminotransferase [Candidatus Neomarinimicrobiota bacterium]MBT5440447.1 pyridoxal phosphate-dependent aminotransferase [Candidatus Neomarinimicrobiota bacterium]MBT7422836.1 pyridoxal phosphate-dependent aminotransferase [Candidatus Neomarinimicrobiota bacterium]MDG2367325.1 pyridoxal phosphate-dependent aminotransferase [Candidatus Neomarinimicrobiota bacterium]
MIKEFLNHVPPMGIYETLYAFRDTFGSFMGTEGTHPWSQGFPLTSQLEKFGGPELPNNVEVTYEDRFYPKAWGHPKLRGAIVDYYNSRYASTITPENVMIFAGGRPGIYTVMAFLKKQVRVRIGNIEWPAYLDIMNQSKTMYETVPFTKENNFHPKNEEYFNRMNLDEKTAILPIISNPQNPSGQTRSEQELCELIEMAEQPGNGILLDEAYEMFHSPSVSGIEFVQDLDNSNIFLSGACTKGLQSPGIRIGWIIASKTNIKILANYSSFGMGGVSHLSQQYAMKLLESSRVKKARKAVEEHYNWQRERYGKAFEEMGLGVYTGDGGFYHWLELPDGMTSVELNKRLFKRGAAILCAFECDMGRPHSKDLNYKTPYERFFRFSFGPLLPESFETDINLFREVYEAYKRDTLG